MSRFDNNGNASRPLLTVKSHGVCVEGDSDKVILQSLLEGGVDYPHGCESGLCGLCKSRLIEGDVDHDDYYESALSEVERRGGLILCCRAKPLGDCVISPVMQEADLPAVTQFETEVVGVSKLTHDITRVVVAGNPSFAFLPGQYSKVSFLGSDPRDFSMANAPGRGRLEFFIRTVVGGRVTAGVLKSLAPGDRVVVKGPYGGAYLREASIGPMLAVAGGSGLAPVRSIVVSALERGMRQPIHVYLGVRSRRDIYLDDELRNLCDSHGNVSATIVLSDADQDACHRTGYVHEVLEDDLRGVDLRSWSAYVAGPPPMVDAVSRVLRALGVAKDSCYADPFFTSADLARRGTANVHSM
jgi:CDP-4-dehydro-6-deoxyglucose reductase/ferredoxin-NAD(P)+ reductase (naphthalene dioxygenase ferredoxin-specific)